VLDLEIPMLTQKFHAGEMDISAGLASSLIAGQFPQWADLPVRLVTTQGTGYVNYRLGDGLVMRLSRLPGENLGELLTQGVLARLAPLLPVPIPELIALGQPTADFPASWGVLRWIDGDTPVEGQLTAPDVLAADMAGFLSSLWKIDLVDGPPCERGRPLSTLQEFTLGAIEDVRGLIDTDAARSIWDHALQLPDWDGPDTWIHADLMPGNLITRNGRLAAVIDFDAAGIGDPSEDLTVAWMVLPAQVRPAFQRAVGTDDATWLRGRARALSGAMGGLRYYQDRNPVMADNARYTIRGVLDDYRSSGR
jgi:aminoglycoside phosphotransferase (APT) family kinase protein